MLDYSDVVRRIDYYIEQLSKRKGNFEYLKKLPEIVKKRNKLVFLNDSLRGQRNAKSQKLGELIKENYKNPEINLIKEKIKQIKIAVEENLKNISILNEDIIEILLNTPNKPYENCPLGKSENDNVEIRKWGKPNNNKTPHWEITDKLNLIDLVKSVENSGKRFVTYKNKGAILRRALINFMLNLHYENGYEELSLPLLVKKESMFGTGQFPKFADDAYITKNEMVLIPTAEVTVTNFHRNEILELNKLPISYCSFSPCFRKEAGAAGKDTRGIIRLHQFSKVELVKIVHPKNSYEELEKLLSDAELILQKLNLPYRIIELCGGDLGFSASKTYDIEVWMPHRQKYLEISSCTNFEDFQARRANIKFKDENKKNKLVHTLNGSALAVDRLFAAIVENYWNEKTGKIKIPEILQKYMLNIKEI